MTPDPYQFMPGGRPAWPAVTPKPVEPFPTRKCQRCGNDRKTTAFANGAKTCNPCYIAAAKDKAKREGLKSGELTDHVDLYHGGAHSLAVPGGAE